MSHFASSPSLGSIDTDSISSDLEDLKSIITDDLFENHLKVRPSYDSYFMTHQNTRSILKKNTIIISIIMRHLTKNRHQNSDLCRKIDQEEKRK